MVEILVGIVVIGICLFAGFWLLMLGAWVVIVMLSIVMWVVLAAARAVIGILQLIVWLSGDPAEPWFTRAGNWLNEQMRDYVKGIV